MKFFAINESLMTLKYNFDLQDRSVGRKAN